MGYSDDLAESKSIALAIYQLTLISAVCAVVVSMEGISVQARLLMTSLSVFVGSMGCILLIFVPKLRLVNKSKEYFEKSLRSGIQGATNTNGEEGSSLAISNSVRNLLKNRAHSYVPTSNKTLEGSDPSSATQDAENIQSLRAE